MHDEYMVTVWTNGTWKVWNVLDAIYARNDPDWLCDFGLNELASHAKVGGTDKYLEQTTVPWFDDRLGG